MSDKNLLETVGENVFSGTTGVQTVAPFIDVGVPALGVPGRLYGIIYFSLSNMIFNYHL